MLLMSKRWMMVSAIGQGVLFSLALTGGVRILCLLLGIALPENVAGNVFLVTSLLAGSLSAYLYGRTLKRTEPTAPAPTPLADGG